MAPLVGLQSGTAAVSGVQHVHRLGAQLCCGAGTTAATQLLERLL